MLVEVAAERHVQHLHAAADAEVGHAALDGDARQRDLEVVALRIGRLDVGLRLLAVAARVEIGAADEEQTVDAVEQDRSGARVSIGSSTDSAPVDWIAST